MWTPTPWLGMQHWLGRHNHSIGVPCMWQNATTKEWNGSGRTIPLANLPITVRAPRPVKLMPAWNLPCTRRMCSLLSGGKDPRSYLLATKTRTLINSWVCVLPGYCAPNDTKEPRGACFGVVLYVVENIAPSRWDTPCNLWDPRTSFGRAPLCKKRSATPRLLTQGHTTHT